MKKILMIDDDVNLHEIYGSLLKNEGYEFYSAYDGIKALEEIFKVNPDLILLDVRLPNLNGFQICQMLNQVSDRKKIPIIMLSGNFVGPKDKILGLELGADDYLAKDVDLKELLSRIKRIIEVYDRSEE
jgi:DNA-binding response OmpR family regulator